MDRQTLLRASVVAARSLRANIRSVDGENGRPRSIVVAGGNQFGSAWTRDFCFAVGGLLKAGEHQAVRDTLDALLAHQRADGLLPRLLDSYSPFTRFARSLLGARIPLKSPLHPNFVSDHFVRSVDSNALVVQAACRYAIEADRPAWAGLALTKLERAMAYYDRLEENGLVRQPPFSDWKDTVSARRGAVFLTQLQIWAAHNALARLYASLGRTRDAERSRSRAAALARVADKAFWDEQRGFYRDTLSRPLLSCDSNLAAAAWGFCTEERAARIVRAIDRAGLWTPWGPRAGERYKASEKGWLARFAGVGGYQDDFVWLWITALGLRVLRRTGRSALLDKTVRGVAALLDRDGAVSEVYDPETGAEVRSWLYRSEKPFSWSAGMLLEAFRELLEDPSLAEEAPCDSLS
jgi:glycogen debranching enzyme